MNNSPVGGPRKARYRDDLWNMKYLSKFKWHHLTEKIRKSTIFDVEILGYDKAVREKRLRTELNQTKKENEEYKRRIEQSKTREIISQKKDQKKLKLEEPFESKELSSIDGKSQKTTDLEIIQVEKKPKFQVQTEITEMAETKISTDKQKLEKTKPKTSLALKRKLLKKQLKAKSSDS